MSTEANVGVTYTGTEKPFKDRVYKSGLTFSPGQSRVLPHALAARFLRHTDVFKRTDQVEQAKTDQAAGPVSTTSPEITDPGASSATLTTPETGDKAKDSDKPLDPTLDPDPNSTEAQMAAAQAEAEKRLQQEDARFQMHLQIDKMDGEALRTFAKDKFGQAIHHKTGQEKARDQVKSMIDQYGMP